MIRRRTEDEQGFRERIPSLTNTWKTHEDTRTRIGQNETDLSDFQYKLENGIWKLETGKFKLQPFYFYPVCPAQAKV